ncbi:MAG TPA: hypothetical protein VL981_14685 [Candidatus Methylacidiphilales bacterium]|nr:hypothetical protein [Candidatus Methylacidiphilales bacterium]
MKLTPQAEMEGLRAYEQVRAFERIRSWRLPLCYLVFAMIPMVTGAGLLKTNHPVLGELHFVTAFFFMAGSGFHWRWLLKRYAKNLRLLAEQEKVYGDQLPWVQVEKHFAALDRLNRDLEREKMAGNAKKNRKND